MRMSSRDSVFRKFSAKLRTDLRLPRSNCMNTTWLLLLSCGTYWKTNFHTWFDKIKKNPDERLVTSDCYQCHLCIPLLHIITYNWVLNDFLQERTIDWPHLPWGLVAVPVINQPGANLNVSIKYTFYLPLVALCDHLKEESQTKTSKYASNILSKSWSTCVPLFMILLII